MKEERLSWRLWASGPRLTVPVALLSVDAAINRCSTLPVAIKAIEHDIPVTNEQFSFLQSSFLISYALMYAVGGRHLLIMVFWVAGVREPGLATSIAIQAMRG